MKRALTMAIGLLLTLAATAASNLRVAITLSPDPEAPLIAPEIYGQFAEHLGRCVYGGLWVGTDSPIPNTQGYRTDVLNALKALHVPVLRWPGGCFADEYHWQDGIGPRDKRPSMLNSNWGGTVEDNSFGTHEFFNLCELLGCEPYLCGNVGSGTVEELAKWVEYITAAEGPMAELRKKNGRQKPWRLKYLGVGNESWGCGGNFTPDYYADTYRRYQTYCRNYSGNHLFKIASGANADDYNWTEVMMQKARGMMDGLSLHFYAVDDWNAHGSATDFTPQNYYQTLARCLQMDQLVKTHVGIMDRYDPDCTVGLLVDEWGTWWDVEPGTNPAHLYQQNTMRDAMVAALTLNIFHKYTQRVAMANIAQIANVLQSMVLTRDKSMVLTPTYHVFKLYVPHQGAQYIPLSLDTPMRNVEGRQCPVPMVSATASRSDNGTVAITIANTDLDAATDITIDLSPLAMKKAKISDAQVLHSKSVNDYNDFRKPNVVKPAALKGAKIQNNTLTLTLPECSIATIVIK